MEGACRYPTILYQGTSVVKGGAGPLSCSTIQWDGVPVRLYYNVGGEDAYSIMCLECLKGGCVSPFYYTLYRGAYFKRRGVPLLLYVVYRECVSSTLFYSSLSESSLFYHSLSYPVLVYYTVYKGRVSILSYISLS